MLQLSSVTSGYGKLDILHDVALTVQDKEVVALLGNNGAGKTTTVKTIAGLIRARNGAIVFNGTDITRMRHNAIFGAGIALVAQGRELFPSMTVMENLELGGVARLDHRRLAEAREEILELFPRLRERSTQRAAYLSGGEQQMLAIGRALMSRPKLLLLDEPTTGLAPIIVDELIRTIRRLRTDGQAILIVEQNIRAALDVADRVYLMKAGAVHAETTAEKVGDVKDIFSAYFS